MFNVFRKKYVSSLCNSFPKSVQKEVEYVLSKIPDNKYSKHNQINHQIVYEKFKIKNESVSIPKRYYSKDIVTCEFNKFNDTQKQICSCIFLLNQDGYIREKYLKIILTFPTQDFMLPFLMNISADYVKEILQTFYNDFRCEDKFIYQDFYSNNRKQIYICYSRMVSYWDVYYRFDFVRPCIVDGRQGVKSYIKDYIGYKLFHECFGFSPRRKDWSELC